MPLYAPRNTRERGSRITDTRILRPGDELQLYGRRFEAFVAVLDSHDPSASVPPSALQLLGRFGLQPPLPDHHHILVRVEDEDDSVISTGLLVGTGRAEDLIFSHITRLQTEDDTYEPKLEAFARLVRAGLEGMYFVSDHNERITNTPQGQAYLDQNGGLLR